VQSKFLHLLRDFSQWAILRHISGNSADISKRYFAKPIGSSNPLWSATKSLRLQEKCQSAFKFDPVSASNFLDADPPA
jgi:hypothetical protein